MKALVETTTVEVRPRKGGGGVLFISMPYEKWESLIKREWITPDGELHLFIPLSEID